MSLEKKVGGYTGWKDPDTAIERVRTALFKDIPQLEEFLKNPKENKEEAANLIRERIGKSINEYFGEIGIRSAGNKKLCPIFNGGRYSSIVKSLHEFEFDDKFDLGSKKSKGWNDPSTAISRVRTALFKDIPELEKLLNNPKENKEKAAKLIHKKIKKSGDIADYFPKISLGSVISNRNCPVFDNDMNYPFAYYAIAQSIPEFKFDINFDLGTRFKNWRNKKQAIDYVRRAFFHYMPELKRLSKEGKKNKKKAAKLINDKIEKKGRISGFCQYLHINTIGNLEKNETFGGDKYTAIAESLHEFEFDEFCDLGKRFRDWNKKKDCIEHVRHALFYDIDGLEELLTNPKANKEMAAELVRNRIIDSGLTTRQYLNNLGLNTIFNPRICKAFKQRAYTAIVKSLHEFEFDEYTTFKGPLYNHFIGSGIRSVPKKEEDILDTIRKSIPRLNILAKNPERNKAKVANIIKDKINEQGSIRKYFKHLGKWPESWKNYKGNSYDLIVASLPEFKLDKYLDLGARYTDWEDNTQAIENVKHALKHDIPQLEKLLRSHKKNKAKAAKLIRKRINSKEGLANYFEHLGLGSATTRRACKVFEGSKYKSIIKSLPEFRFKEVDISVGKGRKYYDFGKCSVRFDSAPERIVGMLLNKYGIIKEFKKDENLHVYTNEGTKHSLDFLVGNTFIEYHPLNPNDKKKGRYTLEEAGEYKWEHITKSKYQDTWFWHIWEVDHLYEILKDSAVKPLMDKDYKNLTYDQFKRHIDQAYEKAEKYDAEHKIVKLPNKEKRAA